ncbi:penicillinase repressor [Fructilactobacillus lindneri]|nr:penicillinase repressor [Fructilactobacillus lindneri]POH24179.1 penicillinase repressor [Fructilactobacillus lindneri DSM 20690 = JCM 11027]POH01811.1 penicillinase repressor [Fructilactobacillus lindneri]POH03682.1 penicillinase repressor [Fructilactobacillus lindneri]POH06639.1 penicillinase repressor [Fructilactobacillus lindneri]
MTNKNESVTGAEWNVMRIVWSLGSCTTREIIDNLQCESAWKDSTIKTLLTRLTKKGFLQNKKVDRHFVYLPLVPEQEAMNQSAEELFTRLCAMKKGQSIIDLVKNTKMTQSDLAELSRLLTQKAKTAPTKIDCNCLPNGECN